MWGAVCGDVIGSFYEVHCTKEYAFPFMRESTFTDDSVLIAAVCRAILEDPNPVKRFSLGARAWQYAAQYRRFYSYFPHAGFGNMFAQWAKNGGGKSIRSYGNGAAMRVIPIGYAYETMEQTLLQAKASCLSTHRHKEAIRGAQAVAACVFLARHKASKEEIREYVRKHFYPLKQSIAEIRGTHVFDSRSSYSVPPAIQAFLESHDYESAVRNAVSLGGDADTQACIAGGIAEAFYGEVPQHILHFCTSRVDLTIRKALQEFQEKYT